MIGLIALGRVSILASAIVYPQVSSARESLRYDAIHSGTPWFDQRGLPVSAHGGGIIKVEDTYYLFGEAHRDMTNAFAGFNCYSSKDLVNWRFERVALPVQRSGALGPETVGERPKVMRSPVTGEYVMLMHADTIDYRGQFVGYATAKAVTGPYTFQGPLLFGGKPIKKWDMGAFQDHDGAGYLLLHGGDIYRLSDDFRSVQEHVHKAMEHGFESPTLFRDGDVYYFIGSNLTGWERNDNYYFTATSLKGPWTRQGLIAPQGTLTWNSQVTFVVPVKGSARKTYMFMGDRWSYPRQASAATYVWQPLIIEGDRLAMPAYRDAWRVDIAQGTIGSKPLINQIITDDDQQVRYTGSWRQITAGHSTHHVTDEGNASVSVTFTGKQASLLSLASPDGGYARIVVRDRKGNRLLSSIVDMYSKYPMPTVKFVTPLLPTGTYTITASAVGDGWYWLNKKGERSGSAGHAISFDGLLIRR